MNALFKSYNEQEIIQNGERRYLVLSLTDHYPITKPIILKQAAKAICEQIDWKEVEMVVGEEEKGGFIAVAVAMKKNLPFSLAKQYPAHIKGEIGVKFAMAYNPEMTLYINGLTPGKKVVLVDDMVDSGGTLIAMIQALRKAGVIITDVIALVERVEKKGVERIKIETGINIKTIIKLDTMGKRSRIINFSLLHK